MSKNKVSHSQPRGDVTLIGACFCQAKSWVFACLSRVFEAGRHHLALPWILLINTGQVALQPAMYHLDTKKQRKAGLGLSNRPTHSLLANFRKGPSIGSESRVAKSTKGDSPGNGSAEEDEISSSRAPSVSTSPRGARRLVPETNHGNGMDDDFVDIDSFTTPVQTRTRSKALASVRENEDINPTIWKSRETHDEETQRLLRAKNSTRVNPQHVSGAAFDVDSVRKAPGTSWDRGPNGKKKSKVTTYGKRPVVRPR